MALSANDAQKSKLGNGRGILLKRLIDTVALPASRISPQNRALAGDILVDLLYQVGDEERLLCAKRLEATSDAPRRLMRYLAQCRVEVARCLLENNMSYDASDLIDLVRTTKTEHRLLIAKRKTIPVTVSDALIQTGELAVIRRLLENQGAQISELGMDNLIQLSQQNDDLCTLIAKRDELRPSQAMAMFWWCDGPERRMVLSKQAADRMIIIEQCSDVFSQFTDVDYQDAIARKTLQVIERRQRNRAALEKSAYESLEEAIEDAANKGLTPEGMQEIGYLCGIKPLCMAKLMSDLGGEGIAVLCKATGLKRKNLNLLWLAMRRPLEIEPGKVHPQLAYVLETYDILSVVKAQTVLRYWNWSLTASGIAATDADNDASSEDSFSSSRRTKKLVFGS
jgi:uncharacterized protein (DUF2336 family)